jgi:hypothetical protein
MRIHSKSSSQMTTATIMHRLFLVLLLTSSSTVAFQISPTHQQLQLSTSAVGRFPTKHSQIRTLSKPTTTTTTSTQLNFDNWNSEEINGPDRIKSCVPYMVRVMMNTVFFVSIKCNSLKKIILRI